MEYMFKFALELRAGMQIPDNAMSVYGETSDFAFYDVNDKYITYHDFDNEMVSRDQYMLEFHGEEYFTLDEFEAWFAENADEVAAWEDKRKDAVATIAQVVASCESMLVEGVKLAGEYGIPFQMTFDGVSFDLRKIQAVDWDSSSMYC